MSHQWKLRRTKDAAIRSAGSRLLVLRSFHVALTRANDWLVPPARSAMTIALPRHAPCNPKPQRPSLLVMKTVATPGIVLVVCASQASADLSAEIAQAWQVAEQRCGQTVAAMESIYGDPGMYSSFPTVGNLTTGQWSFISHNHNWHDGFWPGTLWLLAQHTGSAVWKHGRWIGPQPSRHPRSPTMTSASLRSRHWTRGACSRTI